jgi:hypothetical protein
MDAPGSFSHRSENTSIPAEQSQYPVGFPHIVVPEDNGFSF